MGVDFLRSKAKPFLKAWDASRVDLTRRTLFTRDPHAAPVSAVAKMVDSSSLCEGDQVVVQADGERLLLCVDHSVRAEIIKPAEPILRRIRDCGGYSLGRVNRAFPSMTLAEVNLL